MCLSTKNHVIYPFMNSCVLLFPAFQTAYYKSFLCFFHLDYFPILLIFPISMFYVPVFQTGLNVTKVEGSNRLDIVFWLRIKLRTKLLANKKCSKIPYQNTLSDFVKKKLSRIIGWAFPSQYLLAAGVPQKEELVAVVGLPIPSRHRLPPVAASYQIH